MTIEEKAKAYDEALKRIMEFYQEYDNISNLIDVKRELESIFPQLRESEDERIRKWMINQLSAVINTESVKEFDPTGYEMAIKAISYLEKQKEQKPAEWSEEDENMMNRLIGVLDGTNKEDYHEGWEEIFLPWFKSLPERFNLQPKLEWNEENKKVLYEIIRNVSAYDAYTGTTYQQPERHDKKINFLRTLRPQPHWKPSEEQMNHLAYAYTQLKLQKCYAPHVYESLGLLYDDLKKLI